MPAFCSALDVFSGSAQCKYDFEDVGSYGRKRESGVSRFKIATSALLRKWRNGSTSHRTLLPPKNYDPNTSHSFLQNVYLPPIRETKYGNSLETLLLEQRLHPERNKTL